MPAAIFHSAIGLLLLISPALVFAQSTTGLKILATDPAPDALLARQQPFYVRFQVPSAAPVAVTVSGWFKGKTVIDDGGTGAPALLPRGGIGVVSFFYWNDQPTRIDEVRLHLTDPRSGAKLNDYAFPVTLTWLADDSAATRARRVGPGMAASVESAKRAPGRGQRSVHGRRGMVARSGHGRVVGGGRGAMAAPARTHNGR